MGRAMKVWKTDAFSRLRVICARGEGGRFRSPTPPLAKSCPVSRDRRVSPRGAAWLRESGSGGFRDCPVIVAEPARELEITGQPPAPASVQPGNHGFLERQHFTQWNGGRPGSIYRRESFGTIHRQRPRMAAGPDCLRVCRRRRQRRMARSLHLLLRRAAHGQTAQRSGPRHTDRPGPPAPALHKGFQEIRDRAGQLHLTATSAAGKENAIGRQEAEYARSLAQSCNGNRRCCQIFDWYRCRAAWKISG